MYLGMAIFWFVVGVVIQVFWPELQPRMNIPIGRTEMGFICFVLFSYSLVRWRMSRMMQRVREEEHAFHERRRRAEPPIDPTFDFTDKKPPD